MKLIAGLGNPGYRYRGSRHNIGFLIIEALAKTHKIPLKKEKGILALTGKGRITGSDVVLAMPLTFMNLSGQAVIPLLKKYKISPQDLLVVCDDLDLEFGRQKLRPYGSSGGQRGLKSITDVLTSQEFCRLRIGIGRPPAFMDAADYVLLPFTRAERLGLKSIIASGAECAALWLSEGVNKAMNMFNKKERGSDE